MGIKIRINNWESRNKNRNKNKNKIIEKKEEYE